MADLNLDFLLLNESAVLPTTSDELSPGVDLYSPTDVVIEPGQQVIIDTFVVFSLPNFKIGLLKDKSSVVTKRKLKVDAGVIDTGYRGSVKVVLRNVGNESAHIKTGEPIAQMILLCSERPNLRRVMIISTKGFKTDSNEYVTHY